MTERLAKFMARSGLCSRRDAEEYIRQGRVTVNGEIISTPAVNVQGTDEIINNRTFVRRRKTSAKRQNTALALLQTDGVGHNPQRQRRPSDGF